MDNQIKKKRGRKPKNQTIEKTNNQPQYDILIDVSDDEDVIINQNIIKNIEQHNEQIQSNIQQTIGDINFETINEIPNDDIITDNDWNKETVVDHCLTCQAYENIIERLKSQLNAYFAITEPLNKTFDIQFKYNELTNISCWWCCHPFDTYPVGLPEKMIIGKSQIDNRASQIDNRASQIDNRASQIDNRASYSLFGNFCSLNCALAYNMEMTDGNIWERVALLNSIKNELYGYNSIDIIPSPPKQVLKTFGGYMDIQEYRQNRFILLHRHIVSLPPIIASTAKILEQTMILPKNKELKEKNFVIKRTKPLLIP